MHDRRNRIAWLGAIALGCAVSGCGGEEPKPAAETVELTPGMEQMKQEMMESFAKTAAGKKALNAGKGKAQP